MYHSLDPILHLSSHCTENESKLLTTANKTLCDLAPPHLSDFVLPASSPCSLISHHIGLPVFPLIQPPHSCLCLYLPLTLPSPLCSRDPCSSPSLHSGLTLNITSGKPSLATHLKSPPPTDVLTVMSPYFTGLNSNYHYMKSSCSFLYLLICLPC